MRRFFSSKIRIILVLAVVLGVGLTVIANLMGTTVLDVVVKSVLMPIRSAANGVTNQAERLYDYVFHYDSLVERNAYLEEQLAMIADEARDADAVRRENERLRDLNNLLTRNQDYNVVDAYIINRDSQDWTSTLMIDRGADMGIETGMCAVTETGEVVGQVTEVGSNYAVITTVLDSSLEISATISSSSYNGMVRGGYTAGLDGYLRMDYLPTDAVIRNQDQVVTTGSTVYPRNLILGHIIDAGFDDTGVAKFAVLEPAVDISTIEQVFIITEYSVG